MNNSDLARSRPCTVDKSEGENTGEGGGGEEESPLLLSKQRRSTTTIKLQIVRRRREAGLNIIRSALREQRDLEQC